MLNRLVNRVNNNCVLSRALKSGQHTMNSSKACSYHVTVRSGHFVMTEEKRAFLEDLKHKLSYYNGNGSSLSQMLKDSESQRRYSSSSVAVERAVQEDAEFSSSLETSRNLMCHKRHDVLTQHKSQYFLYL